MGDVIERIFDEIDAKKAEVRKASNARAEVSREQTEAAKRPTEQPKVGTPVGIFEMLFNGLRAAKDVMTPPPPKSPEVEAQEARDYRGSTVVVGKDFTYTIPENTRQVRVQILEPNGRLKNEYTLTNYLAIKSGDKFRLIAD